MAFVNDVIKAVVRSPLVGRPLSSPLLSSPLLFVWQRVRSMGMGAWCIVVQSTGFVVL
jgi:hypothetical protein